MSGLAGIFHLDGRPARADRLRAMVDALAHRGPDGRQMRVIGQAAFGFLAFHTTPEAIGETQPWSDESGEIWALLDGRLDNRRELFELARTAGFDIRNSSDVELVLRSYQAVGADCASRLLGDFAVLIWDCRTRSLVGFRDVAAERPFYYSVVGATLLVASEIRALLSQPEVSLEPNDGMVAEHLADRVRTTDETLFRSIHKLPPAHTLIAESEGVTVRRFWTFDPAREIRYRNEDDYAEHLRELLAQAIRCRLRSVGPVAVDLSGGLDSSSIVSMIENLRARESAPSNGVQYFSMVFPGQPCDENRWIEAVETHLGIESTRVEPGQPATDVWRRQVEFSKDLPDYPNGMMAEVLRLSARDHGCRVRITGLGGDEWLAGHPRHSVDHLRGAQLLRLARQIAADSSILPSSSLGLLRRSVMPLIPAPARKALRTLRRSDPVPRWLGPALRERREIRDRLAAPVESKTRGRSFAQANIARLLDNGFAVHRAEMEERAAAASGLVLREPFNDRRIIEFGLAIPEEQRWLGRYRKRVLRRAMKDLLSIEVLQRTDKADFSSVFVAALNLADPEIFLSPRCAAAGWIDADQVAKMYRDFRVQARAGSGMIPRHLWPLWKILGTELWYNRIYHE